MIVFQKIPAYTQSLTQSDVFVYLDKITRQEIDPLTLHPGSLHFSESIVIHSPLQRAMEAIADSERHKCIAMDELKEIPFSLASLCTKKEWEREGSLAVRRRFAQAFIKDRLFLKRSQIREETLRIFQRLILYESASILSHSFRLKIIEGAIKTRGDLFIYPERIHEFIRPDKKTYEWNEGFQINRKDLRRYP